MERVRLTSQQKQYLVTELKDVVDNYEAYELESPNDYATILSILTGHRILKKNCLKLIDI